MFINAEILKQHIGCFELVGNVCLFGQGAWVQHVCVAATLW